MHISEAADIINSVLDTIWSDNDMPSYGPQFRIKQSIDGHQGFYHGSVYLGDIRTAGNQVVVTSRHGKTYSSDGLRHVVEQFGESYCKAWRTIGRDAWTKAV